MGRGILRAAVVAAGLLAGLGGPLEAEFDGNLDRFIRSLSPAELELFLDGAPPESIVLESGDTLAERMANGAIFSSGLIYHPVEPCSLVHTAGVNDSFAANEERTYTFRGRTRDYSAHGGSTVGCDIPGLITEGNKSSNEAKALMLSFRTSGHQGRGRILSWAADSGNKGVPSVTVEYAQSLGITPINSIPVAMCAEESANPCTSGDMTIKAGSAATDLRVSVLGYFTEGEAGPEGPEGPPGPPGPAVLSVALCSIDGFSFCSDACGEWNAVASGNGPCEVQAEAGGCSLTVNDGICCVCSP